MRNASGYTSKKSRVNRNTNISSTKCVTRKFKEVSRFSRAKQRKGNVQKSVPHEQSCFLANQKKSVLYVQSCFLANQKKSVLYVQSCFLANQKKSVLHVQSCCCCFFFLLIRSIAAVFYRSRCFHSVFDITRFYIYIFFEETINITESFAFSPGQIYILSLLHNLPNKHAFKVAP